VIDLSTPFGRLHHVLDAWDAIQPAPGDPHTVIAAVPDPGPGGPHAKLLAEDLRIVLESNLGYSNTLRERDEQLAETKAKLAAASRAVAAVVTCQMPDGRDYDTSEVIYEQVFATSPRTGTCGTCGTTQHLRNGSETIVMHHRQPGPGDDAAGPHWCEGSTRRAVPDQAEGGSGSGFTTDNEANPGAKPGTDIPVGLYLPDGRRVQVGDAIGGFGLLTLVIPAGMVPGIYAHQFSLRPADGSTPALFAATWDADAQAAPDAQDRAPHIGGGQ
jgi:hypothetical protein